MSRYFRACLGALSFLSLSVVLTASAQAPEASTAPLREVHADGYKILTEAQVVSLTGLQAGSQVAKKDLQAAADRLVQSGLFSKVDFNFQTRNAGVSATYRVEESPRLPVYFDNIPWFADSELNDAIRKTIPFFDGTLPEAGAVVDQAGDAVKELLSSRGLQVSIDHAAIANPTLGAWQALLDAGYPFLKRELLRDNPTRLSGLEAWRDGVSQSCAAEIDADLNRSD